MYGRFEEDEEEEEDEPAAAEAQPTEGASICAECSAKAPALDFATASTSSAASIICFNDSARTSQRCEHKFEVC